MTSPFNWKEYTAKKKEGELSNHTAKKTSTGTVYSRKDDAKAPSTDKDGAAAPAAGEKRGRGRPPGKYGSYKKKIKEALEQHSIHEGRENMSPAVKAWYDKADAAIAKPGDGYELPAHVKDYYAKGHAAVADLTKKAPAKTGVVAKIKKMFEDGSELNELSKTTVASYAKKAANSVHSKAVETGVKAAGTNPDAYLAAQKKSTKRRDGLKAAIDRLTKESVEVNELSKETMQSYVDKSRAKWTGDRDKAIGAMKKSNDAADAVTKHDKTATSFDASKRNPLIKTADDAKKDSDRIANKFGNRTTNIVKTMKKLSEAQLNELSKGAISRYADKAVARATTLSRSEKNAIEDATKAKDLQSFMKHAGDADYINQRRAKRHEGIKKAVARLTTGKNVTKEEVEAKPEIVAPVVEEIEVNVDWSRQTKFVKESVGKWMVSKHQRGYTYGHKEGQDFVTVQGTGHDADAKGAEWAKANGHTQVYVLESFVPVSAPKASLGFSSIVASALDVK